MARRRRRRRLSAIWLIALALLIAGFLTRRMLMPWAVHALTYRAPDASHEPAVANEDAQPAASDVQPAPVSAKQSTAGNQAPAPAPTVNPPNENLSDKDRQQLEDVLKSK